MLQIKKKLKFVTGILRYVPFQYVTCLMGPLILYEAIDSGEWEMKRKFIKKMTLCNEIVHQISFQGK
jgi:hypothetical protein